MAELPLLPSVRTLLKARQWAESKYLGLHEELLAECGVPDAVRVLIDIMGSYPEETWCRQYVEATAATDRTYRRHRAVAVELLACRRSETGGHLDTVFQTAPTRNRDASLL